MNKTFPLYSSLSEEEQKEIFELIRKCVELSEQARREGILALEDGLNDLPKQVKGKCGLYIQLLLRLVVDGTDGEAIRFIGDNYIVSSCETDFERLSFCVIEEGVLSIQCGDNPRILAHKLLSFTGHLDAEKYLPELGIDW